ncbi:hypothetical protein [Streptomyces sp. AC555_RSS877]|uniref:hypothetical protein n=1 Tax=Streptomyces sp. AC555_RSS877 TaxID=2823688 RepID=UPI001C258E24|nr:hypothetical protein [Streptomyces sp. AC555_RSS877]
MDATAGQEALTRLDIPVGDWVVEAEFTGLPSSVGRCVSEWTLDERFLLQGTQAPEPAPDGGVRDRSKDDSAAREKDIVFTYRRGQ